MRRWKSHKVVEAGKIDAIEAIYGSGWFLRLDTVEGWLSGGVKVDGDYMSKHNPRVGGYYVRYADGYESFSPAEAFESGYTPLDADKDDEQGRWETYLVFIDRHGGKPVIPRIRNPGSIPRVGDRIKTTSWSFRVDYVEWFYDVVLSRGVEIRAYTDSLGFRG